ncbi:hypothetical protein LO749_20725 [Paracoccus denitrificans]|uniref:hypothetical protein n=1 Tax=Paracoccus denitrificans TaxID=266 RepID=UPI001E65D082|nr:hypothetical protein [Paracoccus denitrificans]UFS66921.1 hypothetical protein LO749_20725 [Paracoccus denitrificans]
MGKIATLIFAVLIWGALIAGWFLNIFKLVEAGSVGTLEIVRIIGIFMAPVGSLIGWIY